MTQYLTASGLWIGLAIFYCVCNKLVAMETVFVAILTAACCAMTQFFWVTMPDPSLRPIGVILFLVLWGLPFLYIYGRADFNRRVARAIGNKECKK